MKQKSNQEKRGQIMFANIFIVFILVSLAAFCIDGFLLHPIPSQGYGTKFDLSKSNTVYADALILHHNETSPDDEVLLVEKEGQRYLLLFARQRQTGRYALRDEVTVAPDLTGHVNLGTALTAVTMWFENGEIVNRSGGTTFALNGAPYMAIAMVFTAIESLILWQFLKKKYPIE